MQDNKIGLQDCKKLFVTIIYQTVVMKPRPCRLQNKLDFKIPYQINEQVSYLY